MIVMPALVAGINVLKACTKDVVAGTSPAMTRYFVMPTADRQ
jgi:hypothetical protein